MIFGELVRVGWPAISPGKGRPVGRLNWLHQKSASALASHTHTHTHTHHARERHAQNGVMRVSLTVSCLTLNEKVQITYNQLKENQCYLPGIGESELDQVVKTLQN